jgi:hypothetical protein
MKSVSFIVFLLLQQALFAQNFTTATGKVVDSISGEVLAYASVVFANSPVGTMTDNDGLFNLQNASGHDVLTVSLLGYQKKNIRLKRGVRNDDLLIQLQPLSFEIAAVTVRPGKERYSRRNNPAVELIRKVIENKQQNRIENKETYRVNVYEKLSLSIDYFNFDIENNPWMRPFFFMRNYVDTSQWKGQPIIPLSVRETLSEYYYRKKPQTERTVIFAKRHEGVDEPFDTSGVLTANLEEIFKQVDIFGEDINILLNRFVSPLSSTLATAYYKYYVVDTLNVAGDKCVNLAFVPVNMESYAFTGQLYITLDGHYAVKKALLNTPRRINLNWVDQLRIEQEFRREADDTWVLSEENTFGNFYPVKGVQELYAHRFRSFDAYSFTIDDDSIFHRQGAVRVLPEAYDRDDEYWKTRRPLPLPGKEAALSGLLAELKQHTVYNIVLKSLEILVLDHIPTASEGRKSRLNIGPVYSFYGRNYIEGDRFRLGGMTTANLHRRWFAGAYMAYGLRDRQIKYQLRLTHSFDRKRYHEKERPVHTLSLSHGYDIHTPGHDLLNDEDNLYALQVGKAETRMQYIRRTTLRYEKEWQSNLTAKIWAEHAQLLPAGTLLFNRFDSEDACVAVPSFRTSELGIQLRYAPGETKYDSREGDHSAFNLSKDAPVLKLSHQTGFRGIGGSDCRYNHTEFSASKRIWLSSFGHIDACVKTGKVWNRVPFPLLVLPNVNRSIMIEQETFMLMRAMEFVSDEYVSLFLTYYLKGWILNRIPVVNRLKLREVVSFSGMYGRLRDTNNPGLQPIGLFQLPENVYLFEKTPYMEASIGIENIFKIVRIDYFRRLTYRNSPEIDTSGFRIAMRFAF